MKIAIASMNDKEDAQVSLVSGRAPFFLIYDNKKLVKSIKNPFTVGGGAGFSVAQMLNNEGVELLIAGEFGPNIKLALKEKNIETKIETDKTIKQIIEEL